MKWKKWLENWDMTSLKINAVFLEMEWKPSEPDKNAAWDLYNVTELSEGLRVKAGVKQVLYEELITIEDNSFSNVKGSINSLSNITPG